MWKKLSVICVVGIILYLGFDRRNDKLVRIDEKSKEISVASTSFYQYDFARQVLGREENCTLLVSPEIYASEYVPTKTDEEKMEEADLILYNGDEVWVEQFLNQNKEVQGVRMLDYIKPREHFVCGRACICISPGNAKKILKVIAGELEAADEENAGYYDANLKNYMVQIDALNPEAALFSCECVKEEAFLSGETYISLLAGDKNLYKKY